MVIGKIKPVATIVAQFAANVEIDAIQHEGRIFVPMVGLGDFTAKDDTPTKKSEPTFDSSAKDEKKPAVKSAKDDKKQYTEDELMDMETKDLLKLCKEMGIDPDATEGKNTNKKLRLLILAEQEVADDEDAEDDDEDDEEEEKPSKSKAKAKESEEDDELTKQVSDLLEDFDSGKKNKKKTISAICTLVDEVDTDAVADLVDKFEDDADIDLDEVAEKIVDVLRSGESDEDDEDDDDEEEEEKPKKGKSKEKLVSAKDLKVGDKVAVWWNDDNQDWFEGEVKSISKKGVVTIYYPEDDSTEPIDEELHTKIKRIADYSK